LYPYDAAPQLKIPRFLPESQQEREFSPSRSILPMIVTDQIEFLTRHGYTIVFGAVLADQLGLPLPSLPVLLAAGALAGAGELSLAAVIFLAALAAFLSDMIWFEIGRRHGGPVLKFACRASLEPDSCVRRTKEMFSRRASWTLLMAKFVPGMNVVAPPVAGMSGMSRARFQMLNALGAVAFGFSFVGLGYLFSSQIEQILSLASGSRNWLLAVFLAAFAAYLCIRYVRRTRFIRLLRMARISVEELKAKIEGKENVSIIDLRHRFDFEAAPLTLPGAVRLAPEEVAQRHHEIPRDRDIILYCTCPNEHTSARVALLLKRYGITRVRPLAGGFEAWTNRGLPVIPVQLSSNAEMAPASVAAEPVGRQPND
jgi:membrane protein DedA with SNARE-associated domain/rhodanese-related sulfurtransferase